MWAWAGHDLAEKALIMGARSGRNVAKLSGDISRLNDASKELLARVRVSRVPGAVFNLRWHDFLKGRWSMEDHVILGEGRATITLLEKITAHPLMRELAVICLEDNEPWSSAAMKGRSSAGPVNFLLRKRLALLVAAELDMPLPWTDTARQPADRLSREKA